MRDSAGLANCDKTLSLLGQSVNVTFVIGQADMYIYTSTSGSVPIFDSGELLKAHPARSPLVYEKILGVRRQKEAKGLPVFPYPEAAQNIQQKSAGHIQFPILTCRWPSLVTQHDDFSATTNGVEGNLESPSRPLRPRFVGNVVFRTSCHASYFIAAGG